LSDFGVTDEFAGICRLVIERHAPGTTVVDITHGIEPGDVRYGAAVLASAARHSGAAVLMAVVDPGVGTARRAVAIAAGNCYLVGPDNGLLIEAADVLGGPSQAVDLSGGALHAGTSEPAPTFHGRDIFAPAAAHLAASRPLESAGPAFDPAELTGLEPPRLHVRPGVIETQVLHVDRFGNVICDAPADALGRAGIELEAAVAVTTAEATAPATAGRTFGDSRDGKLIVYRDSLDRVAIATNGASAAERLGAGRGDRLRIETGGTMDEIGGTAR
jgi:S-adenosylmethionine hydrolase